VKTMPDKKRLKVNSMRKELDKLKEILTIKNSKLVPDEA